MQHTLVLSLVCSAVSVIPCQMLMSVDKCFSGITSVKRAAD